MSKRELVSRVWPDVTVVDDNLKVNLGALRRVLGEHAGDPLYIATVPGRGYRFVASVQASTAMGVPGAPPVQSERNHNLPAATTRIFGRSSLVDVISADLTGSRIVSVVGPGGIGKTTVALAVAEAALPHYRDGVWLVELAPVRDAALLPNALATALGVTTNSSDTLASLCQGLRSREILIVMDNCEHIIEGAALCADRILAACAGVRILVTTREPLRVRGERIRRLLGLSVPAYSPGLTAAEAMTYPAVQLFVDRATDRLEDFTLVDADAPAVADICRRLDGLALAIELAATRVDDFGVAGIHRQLDNRFRLLTGRRAGPERHRTLEATLDWSYSQLSVREAIVLRAMAVFAGMFQVGAAAVVGELSPLEGLRSCRNSRGNRSSHRSFTARGLPTGCWKAPAPLRWSASCPAPRTTRSVAVTSPMLPRCWNRPFLNSRSDPPMNGGQATGIFSTTFDQHSTGPEKTSPIAPA